jgi:uncharacterized protein YndB with AHSA1/START domain
MHLTIPEPSTIHSTFVIERSYPAPLSRVFAAFSEPDQKRHWFAESENHHLEHFETDFRVGGLEHARYRFKEGSPFPGVSLTHDGSYLEILPGRRIVIASSTALGDHRFSAALATFEFLPEQTGTSLIFTHQAAFFEGADGPEMRQAGWAKLFDQLAGALGAIAPR